MSTSARHLSAVAFACLTFVFAAQSEKTQTNSSTPDDAVKIKVNVDLYWCPWWSAICKVARWALLKRKTSRFLIRTSHKPSLASAFRSEQVWRVNRRVLERCRPVLVLAIHRHRCQECLSVLSYFCLTTCT